MAISKSLLIFEIDPINSEIPFLTRGSPPVNLIFFTPKVTKISDNLIISSKDKIWSFFKNSNASPYNSSGIQYLHLKLHLSVTEILKSSNFLPNLSFISKNRIYHFFNCNRSMTYCIF